jgi:hypothetical protein
MLHDRLGRWTATIGYTAAIIAIAETTAALS